jgi:CRISPR-associated endonuclease/helicase Cas3
MKTLLAKSNGTSLTQHIKDVLQAIKELQCKQLDVTPDEWWEALKYAALLHDLGKIDPVFQAKLCKNNDISNTTEIPHSLLSLFFFVPEELPFSDPTLAHTIVSAVAFHHWRESFPDLLMGYRASDIREKASEFLQDRVKWTKWCQMVLEDLSEVALEYGLDPQLIKINTKLVEYLQYNDLGSAGLLVPPYTLAFLPAKIRDKHYKDEKERLRIFITGNLMRADHFASLSEDDKQISMEEIEYGTTPPLESIQSMLSTLFNTLNYWQKDFFRNNSELQGKTMLLVAPTGFGKTEFAYLWGAAKKNLMLLPMRAAVNKIYDRTAELYKQEQVALLHGDAALEMSIRSKNRNLQETEGEQRKALELARHLSKSFIIATADQIAPAALRYPGYEKIFATLMGGALVIDEVQAYNPQAAAIVTHLIQQNSFFGGNTLLMTATLPPFIRKAIKQRINLKSQQVINLLEIPDFKNEAASSRHRMQFMFHSGNYKEVAEEIINSATEGKKVLVIMNTVRAACNIFDFIRSRLKVNGETIKTALLHSRYTFARRRELEELIVETYMPNKKNRDKAPCIVVSTQVVEASLDIDADIMFTEPAPVDSLIQRMGRVYRRFARSLGNNATERANVIIIINNGKKFKKKIDAKKKVKKKNDTDIVLSSGMVTVYDRDLTALSLVVLLNAFEDPAQIDTINHLSINLEEKPWDSCFKKKGSRDENKTINNNLGKIIKNITSRSMIITEKQKINWVDKTYKLLKVGSDKLNLGSYIAKYQETLDMLDHGYCSDKRRDAMKLFRDVNNVSGIPNQLVEEFYQKVKKWIQNQSNNISYIELAVDILPRYVVNCPYRVLIRKENSYDSLEIEKMIPEELNEEMNQQQVYGKLDRWLSDIKILNLRYDNEKGLAYFEP